METRDGKRGPAVEAIYSHSGWIRVYLRRHKRYSRWKEVCQGSSPEECWQYLHKCARHPSRLSMIVLEVGVDPAPGCNPMPPG